MSFEPLLVEPGAGERLPMPGLEMRILVPSSAVAGGFAYFAETTQPGVGPPRHIHTRQTEIFWFIEGQYEVLVGDKIIRPAPGSTAVIPPGIEHAFRNAGDTPGRFEVMLTPGDGVEDFFREFQQLMNAGPPDMAKISALGERYGMPFIGPPLGHE